MLRAVLFASLVAIPLAGGFGQSATEIPAFEAASVKPNTPLPGGGFLVNMSGGPGTADPGRFSCVGVPLKRLLIRAYGVGNSEISGPDWLNTERYDIVAKLPAGATQEQFLLMLQNLLVDRFQMKIHRESKEVPVYALVVAKGGPKLKESAAGSGSHSGASKIPIDGAFRLTAAKEPMSRFAEVLAGELGRPVIDRTALQGNYNFVMEWPQEDSRAALPSALQAQLGLKLESRKSSVEFLVIDRVEKIPTGN